MEREEKRKAARRKALIKAGVIKKEETQEERMARILSKQLTLAKPEEPEPVEIDEPNQKLIEAINEQMKLLEQ